MGTRTLTVALKANISGLRAGLAAGGAEVRAFGQEVSSAASSTSQSTDKLGKGFLIAGGLIGGALAFGVSKAVEFEAEMRNVATISTYVGQNFDKVSTQVLALSNRLPQSAAELARGLYDVASSGFAGSDGMKVLEASATAASAGLSDTATSGRAITGVLNAYGLSANDAKGVSDVLFQTVNLGVITFGELAQNIGDVIGMASAAHVPIKDVGTAIATITLAGVPAAEATTSLNRVIQSILQPTDGLIEKFHSWGFATGEAALSSLGLQGVMLRLRKETGSSATAFIDLFGDVRAGRGALALTAADGENYIRVAKGMDDATKGQGATARALAEQQKSLSFQLGILKNEITNTAIAFGTTMLPALKLIVGAGKQVVDTFSAIPGPAKTVIVILAALSAGALLVGGSMLLMMSRIGRMRSELELMGPAGQRALGAMTGLGRGIALASGAALAAYGFSALDGSIEGTITGVLSLLSAVGLLRQGLPGLQSAFASVSQRLTASAVPELQGVGVALGGVGAAVGRLGQVAPTLAISGAIMASTMDDMGQASVGGAVNMVSMAATAGQLGFVVGGPLGAAIGATAGLIAGPLMSALGVGGQSVDDYRAKFEKLAQTLDGLGPKMALTSFLKQLGSDDAWSLVKGNIHAIDDELRAVAKNSPDAATKVVAALKASSFGAQFTAKDYEHLNNVIEGQVEANAHADASREKAKASNDAIKAAHKEVTAAATQMSQAETDAAKATDQALSQIAQAAVQNLGSAKGAFEETQQAFAQFGVDMNPDQLLAGFQDKLTKQLNFGANISAIMKAGFLDIGQIVAQEGPEKGGQIAQALADGIKNGDPTIVSQLNETAKLLGVVAPTIEQQFKDTWGPAIMRGQADAFSHFSPYIRGLLGIEVPADITSTGPATSAASGAVADAATRAWQGGVAPITIGAGPWGLIPDQIQNAQPRILTASELAAAQAAAPFGNLSPQVKESMRLTMAAAAQGITDNSPPVDLAAIQAAQNAAAAYGFIVPSLGNLGASGGQAAATGLWGSQGDSSAAGAGLGSAATGGAAAGLSGLPGISGAAGADAAGALGGQAPAMGGAGTSGGDAATAGLAGGLGGMAPATTAAIGEAAGALSLAGILLNPLAAGVGFGIGNAFSSGMASGIAAGSGAVTAAASQVVSDAEAAAKAKAEVKSPSKLFARLGGQLSAGVALGIAQGTPAAVAAARGLVQVPDFGIRGNGAGALPISGAASGVGGGGGGAVIVNSTIEGNVYGDDAFTSKVNDSMAQANRKLATSIRRNRS